MRSLLSLVLMVTMTCSGSPIFGQTPTSQDQDDIIRVRTNEVKLDVVVKDKKGRPIRDLKSTDFEVHEDGIRQKVESFRFVMQGSEGPKPEEKRDKSPAAEATAPVETTATPTAPRL